MTEHFDVLIVGAGLSGIGAARHLQAAFGGKTYAILEARDAIGGTWDLFRYPGVRSDSDMFTLGYRFRPWTEAKAIADGPSILSYVRATAAEAGIDSRIRFGHRVRRATWSGAAARWTVEADTSAGPVTLTCGFLLMCSGYYRYDEGYLPDFGGIGDFRGQVVHPQHWPAGLDYAGKRVVVIGSGATAVTLVPALAETAGHVTMLQRSPTYILAMPAEDGIATRLRQLLGARRGYAVTRWKNVAVTTLIYKLSRRRPDMIRGWIRQMAIKQLPDGYDVDTHFKPSYNPWDQRLCLVPDGDLFEAIRDGRASVVTDRVATFTEQGLRLESGAELPADIVVTATGLQLLAFGGVELAVDGRPVRLPETMAYKGMMLSGLPNFAFTIGYTNASWTLKADLVSEFVCRLLRYMDSRGYDTCVPVNDDPDVTEQPLLDFSAGYVLRSIDQFPRAGSRAPWRLGMSYAHDVVTLRHGKIDDGSIRFSRTGPDSRPGRGPRSAGGRGRHPARSGSLRDRTARVPALATGPAPPGGQGQAAAEHLAGAVERRGQGEPGRRSRPALLMTGSSFAVAAAAGLGGDLVELGSRQDRGLAVAQGQPVGAGQPLEQQRAVVGLGQVAAVGDRPVVAQDDRAATVQRLDGRRGQALRPEAHVGRDADRAAQAGDRIVDSRQLRPGRGQRDDLGRVRVHHGASLGGRVDGQVHGGLGGRRFLRLAELFGVVRADQADVAGLQLGVADPGRGDGHQVAEADADVACAADGQPVVQQACAVADELRASCLKLVGVAEVHYLGY
jgi:monooxygenase